ncbi:MAG: bacteriocin [Sphaerochaetaceae bacterium]
MARKENKEVCREEGKSKVLNDSELSKIQGGNQVAVLHLRAVVPEKVTIVPTVNGFDVESNVSGAKISTEQDARGTTVNIVGR